MGNILLYTKFSVAYIYTQRYENVVFRPEDYIAEEEKEES